jgi:oligoribonuclease
VIAGDRLVWLDMEMTGLDPETCVPLEVAIVITDSELLELASYESVIAAPGEALATMVDLVRRMHTENGLLERVAAAKASCGEVEEAMVGLLETWCEPRTGVLAGNSIWQDRRFLRRYFPRFETALHYRMVDVSSIKELVRRWYGEAALPGKDSAHTAMADIRASIAELQHYRRSVWRPAGKETR